MEDVLLEIYENEYKFLKLVSNRRLSSDVETSSLISDFHRLFFNSIINEIENEDNESLFINIEDYCVNKIKLEYDRTLDLDNAEFYVWHLSMFMLIQAFIKITNSKYSLLENEKIILQFEKLLEKDFGKFIRLNSQKLNIPDISPKLNTVFLFGSINFILSGKRDNLRFDFETSKYENTSKFRNIIKNSNTEIIKLDNYKEDYENIPELLSKLLTKRNFKLIEE